MKNYKLTPYLKNILINCKSFEEWASKSQLPNPWLSSYWMDFKLKINDFEPKYVRRISK
jgi:hypothetical protein